MTVSGPAASGALRVRGHRDELATLRAEHRQELTEEGQRATEALDDVRVEHRAQVETLQTALTTLRTAQEHLEGPAVAQPTAGQKSTR